MLLLAAQGCPSLCPEQGPCHPHYNTREKGLEVLGAQTPFCTVTSAACSRLCSCRSEKGFKCSRYTLTRALQAGLGKSGTRVENEPHAQSVDVPDAPAPLFHLRGLGAAACSLSPATFKMQTASAYIKKRKKPIFLHILKSDFFF